MGREYEPGVFHGWRIEMVGLFLWAWTRIWGTTGLA